MAQNIVVKEYALGGLELRPGLQTIDKARQIENAIKSRRGVLTTRPGQKGVLIPGVTTEGHGIWPYTQVSSAGVVTLSLIFLTTKPYKLTPVTVYLHYTAQPGDPAGTVPAFANYFNATNSKQYFQLYPGNNLLDCGTRGSGKTMLEVLAWIATITGWSAIVEPNGTSLAGLTAAQIPQIGEGAVRPQYPSTGAWPSTGLKKCDSANVGSFTFWVSAAIPTPSIGAITLPNPATVLTDDSELYASAEVKKVRYFTGPGLDKLYKYDGNVFYQAGLPTPTSAPTAVTGAAGSGLLDGTYRYMYTWAMKDAQGNYIESPASPAVTYTKATGALNAVTTTPGTIATSTEFLTDYGFSNAPLVGDNVNVTILKVSDGAGGANHLQIGDTALFYDSITSAYVERLILDRDSTTITIDGAAVTVANNAPISANLRICIYRTAVGANDFGLIAEIPCVPGVTYSDVTASGSEGATYVDPALISGEHGLPPGGRSLAYANGSLLIGAVGDQPSQIAFSDVTSPEYFPEDFIADIPSEKPERITALTSFGNVTCVFKNDTTHFLNGVLAEGNWTTECVSREIGCMSKDSLVFINGKAYFLSRLGPATLDAAGDISLVGAELSPYFNEAGYYSFPQCSPDTAAYQHWHSPLTLNRAVGVYDPKLNHYILEIPTIERAYVAGHATTDLYWGTSKVLAYNLETEDWWEWTADWSMAEGAAMVGDTLFCARVPATAGPILQKNSSNSWADMTEATAAEVVFGYQAGWLDLGDSSVYKKPIRSKFFSRDPFFPRNDFVLYLKTSSDWIERYEYSPVYTVATLSFIYSSTATNPVMEQWVKHSPGKMKSFSFQLSASGDLVLLSGVETQFATPYTPGELKKGQA